MESDHLEFSFVMPCLNEAETLKICINKATDSLKKNNISGEVIIADNGSIDGSQDIARENGAKVVDIKEKGYGNALKGGIYAAKGKYIIMGDSDDSYDFENIMPFVNKLREGYDLVMGNRFKGGIKKGAMPFLHRYLGNPVLSFIGRLFFKIKIRDFHCGLRGFSKEAAIKMDLRTTGMEFASEIVIKAALLKMKITEVPTTLYPDGRNRPPHLNTWHDGWRHLRFLLMFSPKWLFFYPGIFLFILGLITSTILTIGPVKINNIIFDIHTLLYSSSLILIGFLSIVFYFFTKIFTINSGLIPFNNSFNKFITKINLERGLILSGIIILVGIGLTINAFLNWDKTSFGNLDPQVTLRKVIPACTLTLLGIQMVLFSFFFSILQLKHKSE